MGVDLRVHRRQEIPEEAVMIHLTQRHSQTSTLLMSSDLMRALYFKVLGRLALSCWTSHVA
jgi:hypothetical protein